MKYVSRGGEKLELAAEMLGVDFRGKTVLDIGSSTGGFTDYALQNGARRVVAVERGTEQMAGAMRVDPRVELHEKTDIFGFQLVEVVDIVLVDVSFLSLTKVLEYARLELIGPQTVVLAMAKPQFEAKPGQLKNGVVKNSKVRREILRDFEAKIKRDFVILGKQDNHLAGREGNLERFYLLKGAKNGAA